ncbi:hypothetical protein [Xylanimonas protaetiae]|uniref:Uncharacterized protein n=1 Tax=Xylanimonas protaetiae TaxID=2509457 RepID=A0A4P6F6J2_9MICO|nr:hypothetical protein [Xylanimonas protaetiae]QAY71055.1 hypothetical protein ET471_14270 [Xylanimonas protaetiae]
MQQTERPGANPPSPPSPGVAVWREVAWRTAMTLGLVALVKPVAEAVARAAHADLGAKVPPAVVLGISLVWIVVVAARRHTPAVATLVAAGMVQAFAGAVLALATTWVFDGVPGGPLVHPTQLVVALGAGALWGLVCGVVAQALQNARQGLRPS